MKKSSECTRFTTLEIQRLYFCNTCILTQDSSEFNFEVSRGKENLMAKIIKIRTTARPVSSNSVRITTRVSNGSSTTTRTKTVRVK